VTTITGSRLRVKVSAPLTPRVLLAIEWPD
jgi:hypothetical protein